MDCGHPRELLHAYLDGELDAAGCLAVEKQLAECPTCTALASRHRALGDALRGADLRRPAPTVLRDRVEKELRIKSRRRSSFPTQTTRWLGMAAALLLAVAAGFGLGRWNEDSTGRIGQEFVSAHVRSLQAEHLVDVASSNQHTVKPWFAGKLDFAPAVPDLAEHGFALVGGRLDYIDGRPTAALVYKRREHVINLFLQPGGGNAPTAPRISERNGYHILHAAVDGYDCWLVSDVNEAELRELLRRFTASL